MLAAEDGDSALEPADVARRRPAANGNRNAREWEMLAGGSRGGASASSLVDGRLPAAAVALTIDATGSVDDDRRAATSPNSGVDPRAGTGGESRPCASLSTDRRRAARPPPPGNVSSRCCSASNAKARSVWPRNAVVTPFSVHDAANRAFGSRITDSTSAIRASMSTGLPSARAIRQNRYERANNRM